MKKNSLIKVVAIAIIFASSLGFFWACNKEDDNTTKNTQNVEEVNNELGEVPEDDIIIDEIAIDDNTKNTLNGIFSQNNEFLNKIQGDTLFYVINDEQALQALGIDVNLGIDFEKNCLICGRVYSPISSGLISSKYLVYNSQNSLYNYVVTMYLPNSGYNVITPLYFWGVYPKLDGDVIFTLKVVNGS